MEIPLQIYVSVCLTKNYKAPAACGKCLTKIGSLRQLAGNVTQKLEVSGSVRETSHKNWKSPATCGKCLTKIGSLRQRAGNVSQKLEVSGSLREMSHKNWRSPAKCGKYLFKFYRIKPDLRICTNNITQPAINATPPKGVIMPSGLMPVMAKA